MDLVDRRPIKLPCGNIAGFDNGSGYGHRCEGCNAVVGSLGMPRRCAKLMEEHTNPAKGE